MLVIVVNEITAASKQDQHVLKNYNGQSTTSISFPHKLMMLTSIFCLWLCNNLLNLTHHFPLFRVPLISDQMTDKD